MPPIDPIVQQLHDREAIRDCLVRYCRGVDRLDRELILSAYHEDAFDDHGVFAGSPAQVTEMILKSHSNDTERTQHIIANHYCELSGDTAHTETYYIFAGMKSLTSPLQLIGGRYVDRFERRHGRWRIAVRKCVVDWHGGSAVVPTQVLAALNSGAHWAKNSSDFSYERPPTVDLARKGYVAKL